MKFIKMLEFMQEENPRVLDDCTIDIIGTRRPCSGCKGTLQYFSEKQKKDDHSDHVCELNFTPEQGRAWTQSLLQLVSTASDKKLLIPIVRLLFETTYKSSEGAWNNDERSDDDFYDEMDIDGKDEKDQ